MSVFTDNYYYCESSPTRLRRKYNWTCGWHRKLVRAKAGDVAGSLGNEGYYSVSVGNKKELNHRVIWEIFNGPIPEGMCIDHVDGNRSNNDLSNLRLVEKAENSRNTAVRHTSKSGINGVRFEARTSKGKLFNYWVAHCRVEGKKTAISFNIAKYGNDEAFRLAKEARLKMVKAMEEAGVTYSDRHNAGL